MSITVENLPLPRRDGLLKIVTAPLSPRCPDDFFKNLPLPRRCRDSFLKSFRISLL
jgi:hypothetical protein